MKTLTVLSRNYCHLCDDLIAALEDFRGRFSLTIDIDVIDIDQHENLEALWGEKVPVLLDGNHEICHYFFDEAAVRHQLISGNTMADVAAEDANRLK